MGPDGGIGAGRERRQLALLASTNPLCEGRGHLARRVVIAGRQQLLAHRPILTALKVGLAYWHKVVTSALLTHGRCRPRFRARRGPVDARPPRPDR
jgi:hypothetical protein